MTAELSVRFVVLGDAGSSKDHRAADSAIGNGHSLDDVDVTDDVNGISSCRRRLKFRYVEVNIVEIRHRQIQARTLARVERNGNFILCRHGNFS